MLHQGLQKCIDVVHLSPSFSALGLITANTVMRNKTLVTVMSLFLKRKFKAHSPLLLFCILLIGLPGLRLHS